MKRVERSETAWSKENKVRSCASLFAPFSTPFHFLFFTSKMYNPKGTGVYRIRALHLLFYIEDVEPEGNWDALHCEGWDQVHLEDSIR